MTQTLAASSDLEVARRLRMHMGDLKISRLELSRRSGIPRTTLANKLDAKVPFTVAEILAVADALGKDLDWVVLGPAA